MQTSGLTFQVPWDDLPELHGYTLPVQQEVKLHLSIFARIAHAPRLVEACKQEALSYRGRYGFSWQSLKRKFYDYVSNDCDWHTILNVIRQKGKQPLPEAFVESVYRLGSRQ